VKKEVILCLLKNTARTSLVLLTFASWYIRKYLFWISSFSFPSPSIYLVKNEHSTMGQNVDLCSTLNSWEPDGGIAVHDFFQLGPRVHQLGEER
jgi:hypothetical protein